MPHTPNKPPSYSHLTPLEQWCLGTKEPLQSLLTPDQYYRFEHKMYSWKDEDYDMIQFLNQCEKYFLTLSKK